MIRYTRLYDKILGANSDKEAMRVGVLPNFDFLQHLRNSLPEALHLLPGLLTHVALP